MTTPTPTRGVPVLLDRERHLRYSLGTLRKIREEFGDTSLEDGVPVEKLARLIWYGLVHEDSTLTTEQVEDMIDGENVADTTDKMITAMGAKKRKNSQEAITRPVVADVVQSPQAMKT